MIHQYNPCSSHMHPCNLRSRHCRQDFLVTSRRPVPIVSINQPQDVKGCLLNDRFHIESGTLCRCCSSSYHPIRGRLVRSRLAREASLSWWMVCGIVQAVLPIRCCSSVSRSGRSLGSRGRLERTTHRHS